MDSRLVFAVVLLWGICACAAFPALQFTPDNHFFAPATSGTTCMSNTTCAGEGDDCIVDAKCNATNGSCCASGLFCVSGQCAVDNAGASCPNSTTCNTGLDAPFQCISGKCQYVYGPGDECSTASDCLYGLPCTDGVCQGLAVGQTCNISTLLACTYGTTCVPLNTTVWECMNDLPQGAKCPATNGSQCITGTVCNAGTCTTLFSLAAGANCSTAPTLLCGEGLACAKANLTCVATNDDLTSCSTNSDCPNNNTCLCSFYSGNSFCADPWYYPCAGEASDLVQCQADNNCTTLYDSSDSCVYNNCYSDLKKAQSCGCDGDSDIYSGCKYNQFCGGFPVWAIIVIIIVAIVLVLAIVLLVFFMMRRRRVYDSI